MNKIILIGNLGYDAELNTKGEYTFINFTIAVNEKRGQSNSTTWFRCSKFGEKTGILPYLKKGALVCVEGSVSVNLYNVGNEYKASLNVNVTNIQLLKGSDSKEEISRSKANESQIVDDLPF